MKYIRKLLLQENKLLTASSKQPGRFSCPPCPTGLLPSLLRMVVTAMLLAKIFEMFTCHLQAKVSYLKWKSSNIQTRIWRRVVYYVPYDRNDESDPNSLNSGIQSSDPDNSKEISKTPPSRSGGEHGLSLSSSEESHHSAKRKASFEENEYIKRDPTLYGLRRSVSNIPLRCCNLLKLSKGRPRQSRRVVSAVAPHYDISTYRY